MTRRQFLAMLIALPFGFLWTWKRDLDTSRIRDTSPLLEDSQTGEVSPLPYFVSYNAY